MASFTVNSLEDRAIYGAFVPQIELNVSEEDLQEALRQHKAKSKLAIACLNDEIDPDQFLDGIFDALGNQIDPYLDEILLGLEKLTYAT